MGTVVTIVLGTLIIGYAVYALVTGIKREIKGEGCADCKGCTCPGDNPSIQKK
ncbi:MAG: FeoB-associated Cys-rich membrane protein [Clostridia bacterium]|nr:FeoB-associated Cys-rich membrane protein [Clostridia bacterium]